MDTAYLIRQRQSSHGMEGVFIYNDFFCFTMELPWKDNQTNISCIPTGEYNMDVVKAGKFGLVYWVRNVPGRTSILIHSGNWAGDTSKGLRTHSHGCVLVGMKRGILLGQRAILDSFIARTKLLENTALKPLNINVVGG